MTRFRIQAENQGKRSVDAYHAQSDLTAQVMSKQQSWWIDGRREKKLRTNDENGGEVNFKGKRYKGENS